MQSFSKRFHLQQENQRQVAIWTGVLILLLAAILRLSGFEEALIGSDQTTILGQAADIAAFRAFPLVGIKSSVGIMQSPITSYLAAIPLFLLKKVIAIKWFFSILDLLAIAWLYKATQRALGQKAAFWATLLYATSPWIIEFNRWIWYQTLIPTFATSAFAAFLLLLSSKKSRHPQILALGLVSALLMGMVHLAALPLAALLFLLGLILSFKKDLWRGFWAGSVLSIILASPYLIYLLQTRLADISSMIKAGGTGGGAWKTLTLRLTYELLSGQQVLSMPHSSLWADSVLQISGVYIIIPLALIIASLSALWRIFQKQEDWTKLLFALGWTLLVPASFLQSNIHPQHFYLLGIFPAPFILIGAWFQHSTTPEDKKVWNKIKQTATTLAAIALLLLIMWWVSLWGIRINMEQAGLLGAPTRAWLMDRTVNEIERYLEQNLDAQIIILTQIDGDFSSFDWIRAFLGNDHIRTISVQRGFLIPPTKTCYMLGPGTTPNDLSPIIGQALEQPEMNIPANPPWRFYCTPPQKNTSPPLATWANDLALLETNVTTHLEDKGEVELTYVWRSRGDFSNHHYHFFNHLFENGDLIAQVDGPGILSSKWREDDILITYFKLPLHTPLEEGNYQLHMGIYEWPGLERILLNCGDGSYLVTQWP
ncbi:MAG: hypothetical protein J7M17_04830 [Anaerolineae bacterium]|nr:hypothetical protein [Anaerolineae bacterium]